MVKIREIRQVLKDTNYVIKVDKLKEGCSVNYPNKIHTYTIGADHFIFSDENSNSYLYNLSPSTIRIGITVHIMRICHDMRYHPRLLEYHIGSKRVKSMEDILPLMGEPDTERLTCGIIQNIIQFGYADFWLEEANSVGLKPECKAILDIWENQ